jgi:NAD-dependent deacetylase
MQRASEAVRRADLVIVIGSSLQVQPAASLPLAGLRAGATLAVVNRDPTPLDRFAEIVVQRPIGAVFSALFPQLVKAACASA